METLVKWIGVFALTLIVYVGLLHVIGGAIFCQPFTFAFAGGCVAFIVFSGLSLRAN